jgi:hypothetical protein
MAHQSHIRRAIALLLTLVLAVSTAEPQAVNCAGMNMDNANGSQANIAQQHHSHDAALTAGAGKSHHQRSGAADCHKGMVCANGPAISTATMGSVHLDQHDQPVASRPGKPQARTARPDTPPPRI